MAGKKDTKFKAGTSGNKRGRPAGSLNKNNAKVKATIEMVMDSLAETIIEDLQNVNSSRRLQVYIDLMNFIKPKLASTKNDDNVTGDITITFKSDDDI